MEVLETAWAESDGRFSMWLAVIWVATAMAGFLREVPRKKLIGEVCEPCGYSLRGLPDCGVCPECGNAFQGNSPRREVDWGWKLTVERPGLLAFALLCAVAAGVWPGLTNTTIADWLEAIELIARGYRADVAWRAVRMPASGGCGLETTPSAILAAFIPLVGRLPPKWGWRVAIALATVGLVGGSIGWLRFWELA